MHRKDFIKLNALAGLGLSILNLSQNVSAPSDLLLTGHLKPELNHNNLLDKKAYKSFEQLQIAAVKDGIRIRIVSGYRDFNAQLRIWNKKYARYKKRNISEKEIYRLISTYSAIPGTSRHHWGTEIDIIDANPTPKNGFLNPNNFSTGGIYNKLYKWMNKFGADFGFYLVYTDDVNRNGFKFEPWHYSYKPLAQDYLKYYSRLDLVECIKNDKIGGNDYLNKNCLLSYFQTHLLGINPSLLP